MTTTKHINFDFCDNMTVDKYVDERVQFNIKRYREKAKYCRGTYLYATFTSIILSSSIPILINLKVPIWITTIISFLVIALITIENVFHFRDRWKNYQIAEETLRKEKYLFQTKSRYYEDITEKEAYKKFIDSVERIIENERISTIQVRSTEIKTKNNSTQHSI